MGLFLSMTGLASISHDAAERALRQYVSESNGTMEMARFDPESDRQLVLHESPAGHVTILYPWTFYGWDMASRRLSEITHNPAISMHIHDGDLWMYVLFDRGKEVAWFNPIPDYWDDSISDEERPKWKGDADAVACRWPKLSADAIRGYLSPWNLETDGEKVRATDEFAANDCWQLIDFMTQLGLSYPVSSNGVAVGSTFEFEVESNQR